MSTITTSLSDLELATLTEHEVVISRGLESFVEVGDALLAIRDQRLYRDSHRTFEAYCQERWGMTRRHANRLIGAAEVIGVLGPTGPTSERQTRPLVGLGSYEEQRAAWDKAVEVSGGRPTTADVQRAANEVAGKSVHFSSESDEWYTPADIVARVVEAMGGIDLDPCADPGKAVPATRHFTKAHNGLAKTWSGRVYMNPPYGRELAEWVEKLLSELEAGNTTEAVVLVPSRTDTQWFQSLRRFPRCFLFGRLRFSGSETGAPFPSMAVYIGPNTARFARAFSGAGDTYALVEPE